MNKLILLAAATAAAAGLAACSNTSSNAAAPQAGSGDKAVLYSGILPAADADGTAYALRLDYDDDRGYADGDFSLTETTFAIDSAGAAAEVAASYTEGDFAKKTKTVNGQAVEYIQLAPDAKDALGDASSCSLYFIVNPDGSLTMANADLTPASSGLNYTLTAK